MTVGAHRRLRLIVVLPVALAVLLLTVAAPAAQARLAVQRAPLTPDQLLGGVHVTAVATDSHGNRLPVSTHVRGRRITVHGKRLYELTLQVDAGPRLRQPLSVPFAQFNDGTCSSDGSLSVQACVTMYYNIKNDRYNFYADVEYYTSRWSRYDSTARLQDGRVTGRAVGYVCKAPPLPTSSNTWDHQYPTGGATYTDTPSWHGKYVRISSPGWNGQSLTGTLYWSHGTSQFSLNASYTLPNDGGWPHYGGC